MKSPILILSLQDELPANKTLYLVQVTLESYPDDIELKFLVLSNCGTTARRRVQRKLLETDDQNNQNWTSIRTIVGVEQPEGLASYGVTFPQTFDTHLVCCPVSA